MKGWIKYAVFVLIILAMIVWLGGFSQRRKSLVNWQKKQRLLKVSL